MKNEIKTTLMYLKVSKKKRKVNFGILAFISIKKWQVKVSKKTYKIIQQI